MKSKLLFILSLFLPVANTRQHEEIDYRRIAMSGSQIESARASLFIEELNGRGMN